MDLTAMCLWSILALVAAEAAPAARLIMASCGGKTDLVARSVWCGVPAPVVQFLAFAQCAVRAPQDLEKAWEGPKT
jgi:hypothetical protein